MILVIVGKAINGPKICSRIEQGKICFNDRMRASQTPTQFLLQSFSPSLNIILPRQLQFCFITDLINAFRMRFSQLKIGRAW